MTGSASAGPWVDSQHEPSRQLLENGVAKSFFSSPKKERVKKKIYKNRSIAHGAIAEYIEALYNPARRHR
jgi:hypothetical protein